MLEKIEIIKSDGTRSTLDLICEFETLSKHYVLMTANELDQNGLIKIIAAQIDNDKMIRIESEDDWTTVKNVMRSIISSSKGDFTYLNSSDNMSYNVDDDYSRIIAVQEVAKEALIKDYQEKMPALDTADKNKSSKKESKKDESKLEDSAFPINEIEDVTQNKKDDISISENGEIPQDIIPEGIDFSDVIADSNKEIKVENNEENLNTSSLAKKVLFEEIEAAVEKYLASVNVENIKETINKMQEELSQINEGL